MKPEYFKGEGTPQTFYSLKRSYYPFLDSLKLNIQDVIHALDNQNRWLVKHAMISHPYTGEGENKDTSNEYASTYVGDETDTSPFRDSSDQLYISTAEYITNMYVLMNYVQQSKSTTKTTVKQ